MRMWIFIFTLLSSHVIAHNSSGWDVLEDATNRIPIDYRDTLRESDVFRYYLSDDESFVNVKYNAGVVGSVTVKLDEVSQVYRHNFLISGIGFLLLASLLDKDIIDERRIQYAKWFMRFVAVIWLFMSSIDTPLAIQVIVFSLTLNYRGLTVGSQYYSTFHKIPNTKKFSKNEWVEFTKELDQSIGWRVDFFTRICRLGD